jgi:hypothetical protein
MSMDIGEDFMADPVIDATDESWLVRFTIGDVEVPYELPDIMVLHSLDMFPSDTQVNRIYKSSIQCLKWIKAKFAVQGSRRREREGGREVEDYRQEKYKAISDLLDWLEENPPSETGGSGFVLPVFGGTMVSMQRDLKCNPAYVRANAEIGWFYSEDE